MAIGLNPERAIVDPSRGLPKLPVAEVQEALMSFVGWLDDFGETSYDHQSFFAGDWGRRAKALYYKRPWPGTLTVAPMILCEAFFPSARRFFFRMQRFPIADAHYAMGFAYLSEAWERQDLLSRAVDFLENLLESRAPGFERHGWGYPFDWQTRTGTLPANTPFITTLPYVYEAFGSVYRISREPKWREVLYSIAEHGLVDYRDTQVSSTASSCAYSPDPDDRGGVINASAYRAFLLFRAAVDFGDERYSSEASRNLNFVLEAQNEDGSWFYSIDTERHFVDHFHTCFVLKSLAKIELLIGDQDCSRTIEKGVDYYVRNLFDQRGLPRPFSRAPRMTLYRRELYDYAECINLGVLLAGRFSELDKRLVTTVRDLLQRWLRPNGSFRSRKLLLGWDNVPMHRWAQAQLFRALSLLVLESKKRY